MPMVSLIIIDEVHVMGDKDQYTVKYLHENDWDLFCKTYRVRDGQEKQDLDQAPRNPYYAGRKTILTVIG